NRAGMALEDEEFLAADRLPDPHRLVEAGRRQGPAIGVEGHAGDPTGMPLEGEQLLAAGRVPDPHGLVVTGRGQAPAVGAEGYAGGDREASRWLLKGERRSGPACL